MTLPTLTYDPGRHVTVRDGDVEVPHVTGILSATGLTEDFGVLAEISPRVAAYIRHATARGTAVHADAHAYDDDDLDLTVVDHRVLPYVEAWAEFRAHYGRPPVAHGRERHVYHPVFDYAGILDGVFGDVGSADLIDIKTGDPEAAAADLQTAAYAAAWEAMGGCPIQRRMAVWLRPGRRIPYTVLDYAADPLAAHHFPTFLAALTVYREQQRRRR